MAETLNILLLEDAGEHGSKGDIIIANTAILDYLRAKKIKFYIGAYEVLRNLVSKANEKNVEKPALTPKTKTGE